MINMSMNNLMCCIVYLNSLNNFLFSSFLSFISKGQYPGAAAGYPQGGGGHGGYPQAGGGFPQQPHAQGAYPPQGGFQAQGGYPGGGYGQYQSTGMIETLDSSC